jgi:hypothetical protein
MVIWDMTSQDAEQEFAQWLIRRIPSRNQRETLVFLLESSTRAVFRTPVNYPWSNEDAMAYRMEIAFLAGYLA